MNGGLVRLDGPGCTCLLDAGGPGVPRMVHWGAPLPGELKPEPLTDWWRRPLPRAGLDVDVPATLLPEFGMGWFGTPALQGSRGPLAWATRLELQETRRQADGLLFICEDAEADLEVRLELRMDAASGVMSRRTRVHNLGSTDYRLDWCAAAAFTLPERCRELLSFDGQWSQEFQERRQRLESGTWQRENRRGRSSHDSFPQLVTGNPGFGESHGQVYGFHLAWSGNHRLLAECLNEGSRQVQLGECFAPGELTLGPRQSYDSPWVHGAFSNTGLGGLSDRFHRFVRRRLPWPGGTMKPRPVHLNTWEAIYFDHDPDGLRELAEAAAEVGVERFVLDDGWFVGRDNDDAALGDWSPDPRKYPLGLGPLVSHVRDLGMEFGLWVEPEMVNPDSELYRAHPDWALQLAGRPLITGRNQLVLDLGNPLVSTYLFEALDSLLSEHPIGYLKWDMNRDLVAAGGGDGRPAYRRQTLALYELLGRLRTAHPEVEIESCASGGGRPDLGILDHTVRVWASDNNDALARIDIQRGFLRFLPPEIMGSHIGPSPGHVTGRRHPLGFRAAVALFGHLGLELDVRALTEAQRRQVTQWLAVYKRHRGLLHGGRHYNLEGLPERCHGHGVVSPDQSQALYAVMQMDQSRLRMPPPVCLPGLDKDRDYRLTLVGPPPPGTNFGTPVWEQTLSEGLVVTGALLSEAGLPLPILQPETALLLHLQVLEDRDSA